MASPAASALPGHMLVSAFPGDPPALRGDRGGGGRVRLLARHLWRRPPRDAAAVAALTGWVMLVAILLAPATRVGYLLYPINLFVWAWMFRARGPTIPGAPAGRGWTGSVAVGSLEHLERVRGGAGRGGGGDHDADLPVEAVAAAVLGQDLGAGVGPGGAARRR